MKLAISGPSGSSKSTVANLFAQKYNMYHLCLDDYWITTQPTFRFNNNKNSDDKGLKLYELPFSYNGELLALESSTHQDVIMEGFCIMSYPIIRKMVDWHFHITVPWELSIKRRTERDKTDTTYQNWITQSWIELGERGNNLLIGYQADLKNTTVLDGTLPSNQLVDQMFSKLVALSIR